jgi:sterol desaturase/sphingolipid hydroxylase (fatty acid hydroxylase superfamily)
LLAGQAVTDRRPWHELTTSCGSDREIDQNEVNVLTTILIIFAACFLLERAVPGWRLPQVRTWPVRVLLVNAVQLAVVLIAGVTWERWFSASSLFHLSDYVAPAVGGLIAYFIATFLFYWWHRWRHENDVLWLGFHQIHHSPQRLEVITSFYKHPGEMVVNSMIGAVLVYTLLGLSKEAAAIYTLCTAVGEFFYHTNVRTPRWVGYVFQRPEMHRIHHQHGRHRNNYGDITWWDMLFGTYENPKEWHGTCGFDPAKEAQLGAMLAYRDVHSD